MKRFIAAMDHSGGSSPGVLERYGYTDAHELPHEVVMDDIHLMRLRMVNHPDFNSENISHAILYKDTVDRGMVPVLENKGIKAILKIDSGCEDNGYLKYFRWDEMVQYALDNNCVGTKMRSIVKTHGALNMIVDQQFALARSISEAGLLPIVEPEIPIDHEDKAELENLLKEKLSEHLKKFEGRCILKLTLPDQPNLYKDLTMYNNLEKLVGLSGGYCTVEACRRLSQNDQMTASFSRALSEGLNINQTDAEFNAKMKQNIKMIKEAI